MLERSEQIDPSQGSQIEPLAAVQFSFGYHLPEDLPRLPVIKATAKAFFLPETQNIYVKEDGAAPNQVASSIESERNRSGSYLDAYLQAGILSQGKRRLTKPELEYVRGRALGTIGGSYNSEVIEAIAYGAAFSYQEFTMLDELSKTRDFRLDIESYPDFDTRKMTKIFKTQQERMNASYTAALKGDVDSAIRFFREGMIFQVQPLPKRNASLVNMLASTIGDALAKEKPTRIFVRMGETHHVIADRLVDDSRMQKPELKSRFSITKTFDFGQLVDLPNDRLIIALEAEPSLVTTDEQILQAMIGNYLNATIDTSRNTRLERAEKISKVLSASTTEDIAQLIRSFPAQGFDKALGSFAYARLY